jgi:Omp85 superfamily domain/Calcineurin-like phosphoesterase
MFFTVKRNIVYYFSLIQFSENKVHISLKYVLLFFFLFGNILPFFATKQVYTEQLSSDTSKIQYSLYCIGDARKLYLDTELQKMIKYHLDNAQENSAVIFLGDNVEPLGLPDSTDKHWDVANKSILAQLELLSDYNGDIFFIPGNHDWARGQKEGLEYIKNQREFIEDYLDKKHVFLPKKGRVGPLEIKLSKDIVLILVDSQWWLHDFEKNYDGVVDEADFFIQIKDAINRNRNKKIIFATHHPIFSVGKHGGKFPFSYNFFPFQEISKNLFIPFPGFLYTGYRKFLGYKQDIPHPQYQLFKKSLLEIFEDAPNLLYVAGHDHNLQYIFSDSIHNIISGSAGISSYVSKSKKAAFASEEFGFAKLNFYSNGNVELEFWTKQANENKGKLAYKNILYNKPVYNKKEFKKQLKSIDYSDSSVVKYPNGEQYQAGKIKRILQGDNYREEWIRPVEVPVFDLKKEMGGLKIMQMGGGKQTKSLRLEDMKGKEWALRSLEKDPSTGIPDAIKVEFAVNIVQDVISASIPYSAVSVPRLADAVNIFHTNPKIVYLPKDPRLGKYYNELADGMYLFEERPTGNRKDVASFGRSKNIVSSFEMLDEVIDNQDHIVDQEFFLRSRLFDILINDWDRHEDQWRWATFKDDGKVIYKAVPRDRDQTFFVREGFLTWIAARKFAYRKNQGFDYDTKDIEGLCFNARYLDRRFLNELSLEDWIRISNEMKTQLTDSVLIKAVHDMPKEIIDINGDIIIDKLKSRRNKLDDFAKRHYSHLAKKVDVVGTNDDEYFKIERLNENKTKVSVYRLNKKGKKKEVLYNRIFNNLETKELRLYGLEGKDEFNVSGSVDAGIKIRIIGGKGKDKIEDESQVKGLSKKTLVYDSKKSTKIKSHKETRSIIGKNPDFNKYNYYDFKHNILMPLIDFGYNQDDGFFIGPGVSYKTQGFKKYPFATKQTISSSITTATNAFKFNYEGIYTDVIALLDLSLNIEYKTPTFTQNFFGFGNESVKIVNNLDYNRVRIGVIDFKPALSHNVTQSGVLTFGMSYQNVEIEETSNRFITDFAQNNLDPNIFNNFEYLGLNISYEIDTRDNKVLPKRGIVWNTEVKYFFRLNKKDQNYNNTSSDLSIFFNFSNLSRTVFAFRAGGSINNGDYEFFQYCTLGSKQNLRGYRQNRFAGDASFYQNSEIRISLFNFSSYVAKGQTGLLFYNDIGRVWYENENSNKFHHGYGFGLWISPFEMAVISTSFEISEEEKYVGLNLKFLF